MSVTATYTDASAKITVAIASAPANAETALIERSADQITWTSVRGAQSLTLTGSAISIDDYEFSDGVANYYRATYFDNSVPGVIATGAVTTTTSAGATASVTPPLPSGLSVGDVVVALADCTNIAGTLTTATTGWTVVAATTKLVMAIATWTGTLAAPVFTGTGLASGNVLVARTYGVNNITAALTTNVSQSNAANVNIAYPTIAQSGSGFGFLAAFSRSTNTSVSPVATFDSTATGWSLLVYGLSTTPASGTLVVTGGSSATSEVVGAYFGAQAFVSQETGSTTPNLSTVWIKNPLRPYLNRAANVIDVQDTVRNARTGTFDVIARTLPVAVTDLVSGRNTQLTARYATRALMDDAESCVLTGETQFVHAPKGAVTPTLYCIFTTVTRQRPASTGTARYLVLPLVEVAMPDPSLAATLSSWQTVVSTYSTWQAVVNAQASWTTLLQLVGSPTDIITG